MSSLDTPLMWRMVAHCNGHVIGLTVGQEKQLLSKAEGLELAISKMHQQHVQKATW